MQTMLLVAELIIAVALIGFVLLQRSEGGALGIGGGGGGGMGGLFTPRGAADTLTRTTGTWTGSPTFTTIWQRDGTNIAGATAATYVTVAADVGMMIGCVVTGTNAGGFHDAPSNTVGPITATELDDPEPAAARAAPTRHKTKRKR